MYDFCSAKGLDFGLNATCKGLKRQKNFEKNADKNLWRRL